MGVRAGHYHGQWGQEEVVVRLEVGGCSGRPLPWSVGTGRSPGSNGGRWVFGQATTTVSGDRKKSWFEWR